MAEKNLMPLEQLRLWGCGNAREGDLKESCLQYLKLAGIMAYRVNVITVPVAETTTSKRRYIQSVSRRGHPDLIGIIPPHGRTLYVELKTPRTPVTHYQLLFLEDARRHGAIALVVHSVDELREGLRAAGIEAS